MSKLGIITLHRDKGHVFQTMVSCRPNKSIGWGSLVEHHGQCCRENAIDKGNMPKSNGTVTD